MGLLDGKLLKMLILAYNTDECGNMKGIPIPYPVMYNPENFSITSKTIYKKREAPGDSGTQLDFDRIESGEVSFEFLFDATGASINSINGEVAKALGGVDIEIELFLALLQTREPDTHQTRTVTLIWGTFIMQAKLTSATVNYTLFSPLGRPLRAKVSATFKEQKPRLLQQAFSKLFSADLTHVRIVKTGETLPYIANDVYGDSKYYIELAKVNGLKNFRFIAPGTELVLPPLDKKGN